VTLKFENKVALLNQLLIQFEDARTVFMDDDLLPDERGLDLPVPLVAESIAILSTQQLNQKVPQQITPRLPRNRWIFE